MPDTRGSHAPADRERSGSAPLAAGSMVDGSASAADSWPRHGRHLLTATMTPTNAAATVAAVAWYGTFSALSSVCASALAVYLPPVLPLNILSA